MRLNPSVGHLYHDHNISNDFTALDAKETLRTREINAREAKHLQKYSYVIDRAKNTCLKNSEWEKRTVRKSLENIKSRTPSLAKGLLLETEKKRSRDFQRSKLQSAWSGHSSGQSVRTSKKSSVLSPWSVYSQTPYSAGYTDGYVYKERREPKPACFKYNNCGQIRDAESVKIDRLVRKAEGITKALHKLYTKGLERKWRESNTTVLEILGKESKEELEKALFILRGTSTGDIIEDILREKELVSKGPDERGFRFGSSSSCCTKGAMPRSSLNDALLARMNGEFTDMADKSSTGSSEGSKQRSKTTESSVSIDKVLINLDDIVRDKPNASVSVLDNDVFTEPVSKPTRGPSDSYTTSDIREIFERDSSWTMSSIVANPSEQGLNSRTMKWTQLLKAPELWKTNTYNNVRAANLNKPKHVPLVTLTGKRRRTLLK